MHWRTFDETPEKATVLEVRSSSHADVEQAGPHDKKVEREATVAKIMAGFREFSMLLAYHTNGGQGQDEYVRRSGSLPTMLTAVTNQKAEVVWAVLQRLRYLRADTLKLINDTFVRRVHITLADSHSSNILAERADALSLKAFGAMSP